MSNLQDFSVEQITKASKEFLPTLDLGSGTAIELASKVRANLKFKPFTEQSLVQWIEAGGKESEKPKPQDKSQDDTPFDDTPAPQSQTKKPHASEKPQSDKAKEVEQKMQEAMKAMQEAMEEKHEQESQKQSQEEADERYVLQDDYNVDKEKIATEFESIDQDLEELCTAVDKVTEQIKSIDKSVKKIEIVTPEQPKPVDVGVAHWTVPVISKAVYKGVHLTLVGPAGSGKTTACHQVAQGLEMDYHPMSVGPQTTKSDLMGYKDAHGVYHDTPVRKAFEHGGLLLLDEMDSANAGVLTILNSLLANGLCSFPDKTVDMHKDFRCITACNTFGRGADRMYVGRNQLDAATLDRFGVLDFDYDEALEAIIIGVQPKEAQKEWKFQKTRTVSSEEWLARVQHYRKRAGELKQRMVISPRAVINGNKLLDMVLTVGDVEDICVFKGVDNEIKRKLKEGFKFDDGKKKKTPKSKADAGGGNGVWIEHKGGKMPVSGDTLVDIRFADESDRSTDQGKQARNWSWRWSGTPRDSNITAYRISLPKTVEKTEDDPFDF